jgi:hypothetical protein
MLASAMTEPAALLISIVIETTAAYWLLRSVSWPSRGAEHVALAVAVATAVTHPQAWAAAGWLYPRIGYEPAFLILEITVVLAEAALVHWASGLPPLRALVVSTIANAASAVAGLVLLG